MVGFFFQDIGKLRRKSNSGITIFTNSYSKKKFYHNQNFPIFFKAITYYLYALNAFKTEKRAVFLGY